MRIKSNVIRPGIRCPVILWESDAVCCSAVFQWVCTGRWTYAADVNCVLNVRFKCLWIPSRVSHAESHVLDYAILWLDVNESTRSQLRQAENLTRLVPIHIHTYIGTLWFITTRLTLSFELIRKNSIKM